MTQALLRWYDANKRELPWRDETDPYRVWVSEVMLQQTRVGSVRGYYAAFLDQFPDVSALASADIEQIYKAWEGLGYYSRARHLHEAARIIAARGAFPSGYAEWLELPGIGEYTAGAIASICYGEKVCAIDGNVLRVMARYLGIREAIELPSSKRAVRRAVETMLCPLRPGEFNQALMELGSTVCTPRAPKCENCPFRENCDGFAAGDAESLPVRAPKKSKEEENLCVAIIVSGGAVLVRLRPDGGLLERQWEFPHGISDETLCEMSAQKTRDLKPCKFVFTHRIWHMVGALYSAECRAELGGEYRWVNRAELNLLPIPSAMAAWRGAALEALK